MEFSLGHNNNSRGGFHCSSRLRGHIVLAVSALVNESRGTVQVGEKSKRLLIEEIVPLLRDVSEAREGPHARES